MPLILDTNAVLDWLVFRNAGMGAIAEALEGGRLRCVATAAMRAELAHVLTRRASAGHVPQGDVLAVWDRHVQLVPQTEPAPATRLHCTDPSDQMFIDLAQAVPARWLVTRDRALLKLARRAGRSGIRIIVPEAWEP